MVDGAQQFAQGRVGMGKVAPQHKGDLAFDLGLDQPAAVDGLAVAVFHVGEQHAEVGLIDAQLLLHRQGRQADLAPAQAPTGRQGGQGVDLLHGVGILQGLDVKTLGNAWARAATRARQGQRSSGSLKVFVVHGVAPERFGMTHNVRARLSR